MNSANTSQYQHTLSLKAAQYLITTNRSETNILKESSPSCVMKSNLVSTVGFYEPQSCSFYNYLSMKSSSCKVQPLCWIMPLRKAEHVYSTINCSFSFLSDSFLCPGGGRTVGRRWWGNAGALLISPGCSGTYRLSLRVSACICSTGFKNTLFFPAIPLLGPAGVYKN